MGFDLGGLANATPAGAAASIGVAAVSTPTSSTSGDITSGFKNFGSKFGGIQKGLDISPTVMVAALVAVVVVAYLFTRK